MSIRMWLVKRKRDPLEKLDDHTKQCIEELKHTSAYDLLTRANSFNNDLGALLKRYRIPHVVAAGVLLETAIDECTQEQQVKYAQALLELSRYIDRECIKKEPLVKEEKH